MAPQRTTPGCAFEAPEKAWLGRPEVQLRELFLKFAPHRLPTLGFDELVSCYSNVIRRFVRARGVPEDEIEDVIQEVWLAVAAETQDACWQRLDTGLSAWFFTVVRNKSVDALRRRRRQPAICLDEIMGTDAEPFDAEADPAVQFDRAWECSLVHVVLAQLRVEVGEDNFRLLTLVYLKEKPACEVASHEGLTDDQLDCRLRRSKRKLRAALSLYSGFDFQTEQCQGGKRTFIRGS